MNRQQIKAKLQRLLGKSAYWRINDKAKDADERARLAAELPALQAAAREAKERMDAKRAELLADPEYLAMRAAYKQADDDAVHALYYRDCYRIEVGTSRDVGGMNFLSQKAAGDTWDEVFAKLSRS